jgi:hypothetical protein
MRAAIVILAVLAGLVAGAVLGPMVLDERREDRSPPLHPDRSAASDQDAAELAKALRDLDATLSGLKRVISEVRQPEPASEAGRPGTDAPAGVSAGGAGAGKEAADAAASKNPLRAAYEVRREPVDVKGAYKSAEDAKNDLVFLTYAEVIARIGPPAFPSKSDAGQVFWVYQGANGGATVWFTEGYVSNVTFW